MEFSGRKPSMAGTAAMSAAVSSPRSTFVRPCGAPEGIGGEEFLLSDVYVMG